MNNNAAVLLLLGAGKTETTKKVLSFLASAASRKDQNVANGPGIEEKILQSNPLLEALGRNNFIHILIHIHIHIHTYSYTYT